jgi:DNA-binding NarL/FixJ family response regulator
MRSWVSRANSELRAADGRPSGSHALTAQQRQVALLAADGLSNQQIAGRLALSSRTVGSHLSRAFTTLGIHRRTQLMSALAQAPATPASEHISDGAPKI